MSEYIGKKYGMLTIISHRKVDGRNKVICLCDCGKTSKEIDRYSVISGASSSCGCRAIELAKQKIAAISQPCANPRARTLKHIKATHDKLDLFTMEEFENMIFDECYFCAQSFTYESNVFRNKRDAEISKINGKILHNSIMSSKLPKDQLDKDKNNYVSSCRNCRQCNLNTLFTKREARLGGRG